MTCPHCLERRAEFETTAVIGEQKWVKRFCRECWEIACEAAKEERRRCVTLSCEIDDLAQWHGGHC